MTHRTLTSHQITPNDPLTIYAADAPGAGGASQFYVVAGLQMGRNPSMHDDGVKALMDEVLADPDAVPLPVIFQNGLPSEHGINGLTIEALLAICIDRLEGFQAGKFANAYNARALTCLTEAQNTLHERTRERMARDAAGTHQL